MKKVMMGILMGIGLLGFTSIVEAQNTYTITATAGPNGSISPTGVQTVQANGSQTYTFKPNSGYQIDEVLINGTKLTGTPLPSSYTFSNVTSDQTIKVTFKVGGAYGTANGTGTTANPGKSPGSTTAGGNGTTSPSSSQGNTTAGGNGTTTLGAFKGKSPCDYLTLDQVSAVMGTAGEKSLPIGGVTCMYVRTHAMVMIVNTDATPDAFNSMKIVPGYKPVEGIGEEATEMIDSKGGVSIFFLKNEIIAGVKVDGLDKNQARGEALAKLLASKF